MKPIPTHEKIFAVGKSGPNATFNLIFLGLGWPWVGEFVGFTNNIHVFSNPTEFGKSQTFCYVSEQKGIRFLVGCHGCCSMVD